MLRYTKWEDWSLTITKEANVFKLICLFVCFVCFRVSRHYIIRHFNISKRDKTWLNIYWAAQLTHCCLKAVDTIGIYSKYFSTNLISRPQIFELEVSKSSIRKHTTSCDRGVFYVIIILQPRWQKFSRVCYFMHLLWEYWSLTVTNSINCL